MMNKRTSFFIDFIRVLAAQFVLWGHCFSFFGLTFLKDETYFPYIQNIGVVMLFAISGFLFSFSVRKRASGSFKSYYANRFIRIKIPFISALTIVALLSFVTIIINQEAFQYYGAFNIKTFVMNFFMFQDYPLFVFFRRVIDKGINISSFASARPFWTLAIEWWYYMFFGYFWYYLKNKKHIRVKDILALGFLSVVPIYNSFGVRGNCLTFVWLGGVMIENIYKTIVIKSKKLILIMLTTVFFLVIVTGYGIKDAYNRSFQILILLLFLMFLIYFKDCNEEIGKSKYYKMLKCMSSYSYSLYLLHYSIIDCIFCIPNWNVSNWLKMLIAVMICNISAYLHGQVFEKKDSILIKYCSEKIDRMFKITEA